MKQSITKEQWNELDIDSQVRYMNLSLPEPMPNYNKLVTIGQMIEFLGDDWWNYIEADYYNKNDFELCDALWLAVKHKLNDSKKI